MGPDGLIPPSEQPVSVVSSFLGDDGSSYGGALRLSSLRQYLYEVQCPVRVVSR